MTRKVIRPHEVCGVPLGGIHVVINRETGQRVRVVYQRTSRGFGNIRRLGKRDLQMRTEPPREDARSEAQLLLRRRMAAAVRAYQALDDIQRAALKARANPINRTGYNLFIAEFCAAHPVEEFIEDRVKLEFYGDTKAIARPFSVLKFYILSR
jgi:hypothetical protein